eukprot:7287922-Prymnesium_polylepis.1
MPLSLAGKGGRCVPSTWGVLQLPTSTTSSGSAAASPARGTAELPFRVPAQPSVAQTQLASSTRSRRWAMTGLGIWDTGQPPAQSPHEIGPPLHFESPERASQVSRGNPQATS